MQDERIKSIADWYKWFHQVDKTVEECVELVLALMQERKAVNEPEFEQAKDHIFEEIADVRITTGELVYLLDKENGEKKLCEIMDYKLNRQINRMKREGWEEK